MPFLLDYGKSLKGFAMQNRWVKHFTHIYTEPQFFVQPKWLRTFSAVCTLFMSVDAAKFLYRQLKGE